MLTRFFRTTFDLFDQPLLDAIPCLVALSLPLRVPTIFPLELLGRFAAASVGDGGHGGVHATRAWCSKLYAAGGHNSMSVSLPS